jgi:hypothetical protein
MSWQSFSARCVTCTVPERVGTSLFPWKFTRPLHHLQSLGYGLDVFLCLEPESSDGVTTRVMWRRRSDGRQLGGGRGGARRCVGRGHDGRCEVARIAGLWVREETWQRADEWRGEPRVHGQGQAGPCSTTQGPYRVVVVEPQPRCLHLLLTSPLRTPVLEPHLRTRQSVNLNVTWRPLVDKIILEDCWDFRFLRRRVWRDCLLGCCAMLTASIIRPIVLWYIISTRLHGATSKKRVTFWDNCIVS